MTADIRFDEIRAWLFDAALPLWAERGSGGPCAFHEALDLTGEPCIGRTRRVRVIARQVYVFSHAASLGWDGPALQRARAGVDALLSHAWLGTGRGWARVLDPDGAVLDARPDLYDFAFILFGLGWWMQASGDRTVEPYVNQTLDLIERGLPHPSGRGHAHLQPSETPYQQNPHMHLLEACLVLDRATQDPRWIGKSAELVSLFRDSFFDRRTGVLTEFFDGAWRPAAGEAGRRVEPGHQFEWAWILRQYMERTGEDLSAEIGALLEFAETKGVSRASGLAYGAVTGDGAVLEPWHRIWPQTERIKGNLAAFDLTGQDRSVAVAAACDALLDVYLAPAPRGAWIDVVAEDRAPLAKDIPASTFYHLFLAFAELLRLEPRLKG